MQALRDIYGAHKTSAAEDQDAALEGTLELGGKGRGCGVGGGGVWLNGKTRGGSGGLLSGGGSEDGGVEQSETDVFVSVLEGIQHRGGRRQRAETHFCVHPSKSRQNRNFLWPAVAPPRPIKQNQTASGFVSYEINVWTAKNSMKLAQRSSPICITM